MLKITTKVNVYPFKINILMGRVWFETLIKCQFYIYVHVLALVPAFKKLGDNYTDTGPKHLFNINV